MNTCLIKSTAHVLHDMKSINNNLSVRKEFWNHWDVTARHINGNDFHAVPSLFRIPEEIIANSCLCPILKDGDDFLGLKILCNEGKLSFLIRKLIDGEDFRQTREVLFESEFLEFSVYGRG